MAKFPFVRQLFTMDCGPTCLQMILKYYGRNIDTKTIREEMHISRLGVSLLGIAQTAENHGFKSLGVKLTFKELVDKAPLPAIIHWDQNHFIIVYRITKNRIFSPKGFVIHIADPARGLIKYTQDEFNQMWVGDYSTDIHGLALLLTPTADFYNFDKEENTIKEDTFSLKSRALEFITSFKKYFTQVILGLLVSSVLQVGLPFLTQSVVDVGINTKNLSFIYIILFAQLAFFLGKSITEFVRSWLLLHISTHISLSLLIQFVTKLMKLPISFFDAKVTGDILQRMSDHRRLERFLTSSTVNILFSIVNLLIFSFYLFFTSQLIFFSFIAGTLLYSLWIILFLNKIRQLDYKRFKTLSKEQSITMQLILGMQEIKIQNSERIKRLEWESIQSKIFKLGFDSLALAQYQQAGALFLNEGKNIFITFLAAREVVEGNISLGTMLAIQYIIGQLNSPVEQAIEFVKNLQEARISVDRMNEIYKLEDEEKSEHVLFSHEYSNGDIVIQNLHFRYPGSINDLFTGLNITIPMGKTTAIVGTSGSGKTTILKLLLKFYEYHQGNIFVGNTNINVFTHSSWRKRIGVVLQDSYIFSDSVAKNIAVGDEYIDKQKLDEAIYMSNLSEFVDDLPLKTNTKIGPDGLGISQGQRQRILIARAIYKNPDIILLDEATNSLDANNEKIIVKNLNNFFQGKTVVVVAHRLSTVKNAHQIIVVEKGSIIEVGNHEQLIKNKSRYFELIENQLELGE